MLKIKINLDLKSYQTLLEDMKLFKIIKSDGTPNKNKFINILFKNYYTDYINDIDEIINSTLKVMKKYGIENNEFANELALELYDFKNKSINTYYTESLTFYLSDENEFIFNTLNAQSFIGASGYFRKLIYHYLDNPQFKREQIIYKHILSPIYNAIENHNYIKLRLENSDITIKPYKIGTSKEEIYSYLLGMDHNTPISLHILKIKNIITLKNQFSFSENEKINLDEIIKLGIQFPFKSKCNAQIELTPQGINLFNSKYLNRPIPYQIIDSIYYFSCSFDQLFMYFSSFGNNAKIIEPDYLSQKIYNKYKEYIEEYEKKA